MNDFNAFGRVYQVRAQADQHFRQDIRQIGNLRARAANGALVPLGTLVDVREVSGPDLILKRYNMYIWSAPAGAEWRPAFSRARRSTS